MSPPASPSFKYIDGEIQADEFDEWQERLVNDPELRQEYYQSLMLEEALRMEFRGNELLAATRHEEEDNEFVKRIRRRSWMRTGLISAALVMLSLVCLHFLKADPYIGKLEASADAVLSGGGFFQSDSLGVGEVVRLHCGVVTLEVKEGVEAMIEGRPNFKSWIKKELSSSKAGSYT